ncbi:hypothetical protein, partial [Planomonospora parontospora]|uniref:hypothetical protein n=1 Tax=Planomonospora parontospora TaxID=58119 RepID=UPI001950E9A5
MRNSITVWARYESRRIEFYEPAEVFHWPRQYVWGELPGSQPYHSDRGRPHCTPDNDHRPPS